MNKRIVSFFFLLLFTGSIYAAIDITDLRTELLKSPEGIDVRQPRLSWRIESDEQNVIQTAYHILVASSPELLEQEKGDIWAQTDNQLLIRSVRFMQVESPQVHSCHTTVD